LVRAVSVLFGLSLLAGLVSACGDDGPPSINYVVDARVITYNANTVSGNSDGALMVTGRLLPGFSLLGPQGQVVPDRDVGVVTRVPGSRLTLRYEFDPEAAFSDGVALDCDDLLLAWAAMSGRFDGFTPATTAGYRDIESVDCAAGERTATVTFKPGREYQDWAALFGAGTMMPAHVVASDAGIADIVDPIRAGNDDVIRRIAGAWNNGFPLVPGPIDAARLPASGPFRVDRYSRTDGLVLVPNEKWWGDRPKAGRIVVWGRGTDATRRLPDGRFDIADITTGMVDAEVSGSSPTNPARALAVEQLVLADRGVFADVRVRRAFASCVPRDGLARQFGAGARMWNQRIVAPADNLAGQINNEFGRAYQRPDLPRARNLLEQRRQGAGAVRVRIGYLGPTARWQQMVRVIADSCARANITVEDVSTPQMGPTELGRTADALLVASGATSAAAGAADPTRDAYALRGGDPLNLSDFRDPQVSRAVDQLAVSDSVTERLPLIRAIENAAWTALPSIPLFAAPRVYRWNDRVGNVVAGLGRSGTGWNMDRWFLR